MSDNLTPRHRKGGDEKDAALAARAKELSVLAAAKAELEGGLHDMKMAAGEKDAALDRRAEEMKQMEAAKINLENSLIAARTAAADKDAALVAAQAAAAEKVMMLKQMEANQALLSLEAERQAKDLVESQNAAKAKVSWVRVRVMVRVMVRVRVRVGLGVGLG